MYFHLTILYHFFSGDYISRHSQTRKIAIWSHLESNYVKRIDKSRLPRADFLIAPLSEIGKGSFIEMTILRLMLKITNFY